MPKVGSLARIFTPAAVLGLAGVLAAQAAVAGATAAAGPSLDWPAYVHGP